MARIVGTKTNGRSVVCVIKHLAKRLTHASLTGTTSSSSSHTKMMKINLGPAFFSFSNKSWNNFWWRRVCWKKKVVIFCWHRCNQSCRISNAQVRVVYWFCRWMPPTRWWNVVVAGCERGGRLSGDTHGGCSVGKQQKITECVSSSFSGGSLWKPWDGFWLHVSYFSPLWVGWRAFTYMCVCTMWKRCAAVAAETSFSQVVLSRRVPSSNC